MSSFSFFFCFFEKNNKRKEGMNLVFGRRREVGGVFWRPCVVLLWCVWCCVHVACGAEEADGVVTVDFGGAPTATVRAVPTFTFSPNPLLSSTGTATVPKAVRKELWKRLKALGAERVRYAPAFHLPRYGCALADVDAEAWDVAHFRPALDQFMAAQGARSVVVALGTLPAQYFVPRAAPVPASPDAACWDYASGEAVVADLAAVAEYMAAVYDFVVRGAATDPSGALVNGTAAYAVQHWEVHNENEHMLEPQVYQSLFQKLVTHASSVADATSASTGTSATASTMPRFVALSGDSPAKIADLLAALAPNVSSIALHHRSRAASRTNVDGYEAFFSEADVFVARVRADVLPTLDLLPDYENITILVDNVLTLLPDDDLSNNNNDDSSSSSFESSSSSHGENDDNKPTPTQDEPPGLYWLASGASFVYLYAQLAALGRVEAVGMGVYSAHPALPAWAVDHSAHPSASMTNWTTGAPTARYWALKLLVDHVPAGTRLLARGAWAAVPRAECFCARSRSRRGYPPVTLQCSAGDAVITDIAAALHGVLGGTCGNVSADPACRADLRDLFAERCLNRNMCTVPVMPLAWADPCPDRAEDVFVQAACSVLSGAGSPEPSLADQVFVQPLVTPAGTKKLLVVNTQSAPTVFSVSAANAPFKRLVAHVLDAATNMTTGPRAVALDSTSDIPIQPFAVMVLVFDPPQ